MSYKPKIVLRVPMCDPSLLGPFVEACLRDKVQLIAVVGDGCEVVHDAIDRIIVGEEFDETRLIATTWHTDETVSDVVAFASDYMAEEAGEDSQLVCL